MHGFRQEERVPVSNFVNNPWESPSPEVIAGFREGCKQLIHRLCTEKDTLIHMHRAHAEGIAARLTRKWDRFESIREQGRSPETAAKLFCFLRGAAGCWWDDCLRELATHLAQAQSDACAGSFPTNQEVRSQPLRRPPLLQPTEPAQRETRHAGRPPRRSKPRPVTSTGSQLPAE